MRSLLMLGLVACVTPVGAAWDPVTGTITNERWASGLPLGAPGHGFIEFGTDGSFGGLTTQHNPARPTGLLKGAFVAVACDNVGRILRRPLPDEYDNVQTIATTKAMMQFPRGTIRYGDPEWPLETALTAISPLVPVSDGLVAWPAVLLRLKLTNPTGTARRVRVAFAWPNTIGFGADGGREFPLAEGRGVQPTYDGLRYIASETAASDDVRGNALGEYYVTSAGLNNLEPLTGWNDDETSLSWWRSFVEGEKLPVGQGPSGALAGWCEVPAGGAATVDYVLAWSFPQDWVSYQVERVGPEVEADRRGPQAVFDGDASTRWTTGRPMVSGDELVVYLARPSEIGGLVLDWQGSPQDGPRGLRVELAPTTQTAALDLLELCDLAPTGRLQLALDGQEVRSLALRQLGWSGEWWWSVHELQVLDRDGKPVPIAAVEARLPVTERVELGRNQAASQFGQADRTARGLLPRGDEVDTRTAAWQHVITGSSLPTWLQRKLLNDAAALVLGPGPAKMMLSHGEETAADLPPGAGLREFKPVAAGPAWLTEPWSVLGWPEASGPAGALNQSDVLNETAALDWLPTRDGVLPLESGRGETADLRAAVGVLLVGVAERVTRGDSLVESLRPLFRRALVLLRREDAGSDLPEGYRLGLLAVGWAAADKLGLDHLHAAPAKQAWIDQVRRADYPTWDIRDAAGLQLAQSVGLEPPLPEPERSLLLKQLLARCQQPFWPVPAAQVDAEGNPRGATVALPALQAQLGAAAIANGFVADGLQTLHRAETVARDLNHNPWHQPAAYEFPHGGEVGPRGSLTEGASWHVLSALTGMGWEAADTLRIAPRLLPGRDRVVLPFFLPRLRGQVEYAPGKGRLRLHIIDGGAGPLRHVRGADGTVITLPQAIALQPGLVVNLDAWCDLLRPKHDLREVGFTVGRKPTRGWGYPANRWRARVIGNGIPTDSRLEAPLAFDGDRATHWSTIRPMQVGDTFQLDFGEVLQVGRVDLDPGDARREFPRGLRVEASSDGVQWQALTGVEVLTADEGSVRVTFPARGARHLRLTNLGTATGLPWSMAEVYVLP